MARNVSDLALLFSVQAGYDPRAPLTLEGTARDSWRAWTPISRASRSAGSNDLGGWAPYEPGVLELGTAALKTFETLGCSVEVAVARFPDRAEHGGRSSSCANGSGRTFGSIMPTPRKRALLKPEAI